MSAATYSPTFAVPSAVSVLTVVFGMGTGVSPIRIATDNDVVHFVNKSQVSYAFDASASHLRS